MTHILLNFHNFSRIQKDNIVPTSYLSQTIPYHNTSWNWNIDENLKVFVPDESNLEKSIHIFIELYSTRTRADQEYWLLDISSWTSPYKVISQLNNLSLDLDDDLYFYSYKSELNMTLKTDLNLKIWEFYEIHPSRPRKLKEYGIWNLNGLVLAKQTKWIRRRNLEVMSDLLIVQLESTMFLQQFAEELNLEAKVVKYFSFQS